MEPSTTHIHTPARPFGVAVAGLAFVGVRDGLWRVASRSGAILGHIEQHNAGTEHGPRFAARLLRADGVHSTTVGEFWSAQAAAECFR